MSAMTQAPMARGRPGRVLVVDDEAANIRVLAEALGDGFEICFAQGGARALQIAAEQLPDLILLDVVMPELDGFEVLRRLKADPRTQHTPVIFVTAMDEIADEQRGFALGAVDYITKPVSPPRVRARARTHIELKRQRDLLEEHAALDGLTGIANRRRFDAELDLRWRASQRNGTGLLLALLDVDHFKQFNDHYGHGPGDDCLRRVAGALADGFSRGEDFAARYGGEEFALILPVAEASAQLRRLLDAIRRLAIPHERSSVGPLLSVSVGALELVPQEGHAVADALTEVDTLLYAAKRDGRNRCMLQRWPSADVDVILPTELATPADVASGAGA